MKRAIAALALAACGSKSDAPPAASHDAAVAVPAAAIAGAASTRCVIHRLGDNRSFAEGRQRLDASELIERVRDHARVPPIGDVDQWAESLDRHAGLLLPPLDRAAAEAALAKNDDPFMRGAALAALDRTDEIAKAPPADAYPLAVGWMTQALASGKGVTPGVAAAVAARGADTSVDADLVRVLADADTLGFAAELAPLRRALEAPPPTDASALLDLYHAALTGGGDDAELATLEQAIAGKAASAQAKVLRAVDRGSLDDGLAAINAYDGRDADRRIPAYLAWLWARHVAAGFDAGFEGRLAAAACKPIENCLVDVVSGSAIHVTADGWFAGATKVTDLTARCTDPEARHKGLNVLAAPDAPAAQVLDAARTAVAAGWDSATIAIGGDQFEVACVVGKVPPPPSSSEEERVVLSALVDADGVWLTQSRIGEQQHLAFSEVKGAVDDIGASAFFADRKDAELAVSPGVPASALLAISPLCARFPELTILAPDALTAKPQR